MFPAKLPSSVGHESILGVLPPSTLLALTLQVIETRTNHCEALFSVGLKSVAESFYSTSCSDSGRIEWNWIRHWFGAMEKFCCDS